MVGRSLFSPIHSLLPLGGISRTFRGAVDPEYWRYRHFSNVKNVLRMTVSTKGPKEEA